MKIGSEEHKQRFCNAFITSHRQFDPESLAWPDLDPAALERLHSIPFWQQVVAGRGTSLLRNVTAAHYYSRAIGRLVATVWRGRGANDGKDFSATQASVFLDGFTLRGFVGECCDEHARRMAEFDRELLQPRFLPKIAGIVLAALPLRRAAPRPREKGA